MPKVTITKPCSCSLKELLSMNSRVPKACKFVAVDTTSKRALSSRYPSEEGRQLIKRGVAVPCGPFYSAGTDMNLKANK